ncbi:MAG: thiosulfohydrolase SoxB, partial [Pseudomonadota bacterium]
GKIEFLAQNVNDATWGELIFKPYVIREINKVPVAIIGQAFPYTPIANPRYLIPDWTFGINDDHMQKMVDEVRAKGAHAVVVLSHNGMDVDIKMAGRVRGIDAILGGHTHDAVPAPFLVENPGGKTLVINSGSNGKFLSVLDLDVRHGKVMGYRYKLLPIFANLLAPDKEMAAYVEAVRKPYQAALAEKLAVSEGLLYRRGNFNGTFDQLIVDALLAVQDAEIAFSPGFRWGTTLLPGDTIDMEHLMDQTAITYATATTNHLTGEQMKAILEDIADNLFHPDPYYQQGGDMVRVGGLQYTLDLTQSHGNRIQDMALNGKHIAADKTYKVAGWASVQPQQGGRPVWEIVAEYLRTKKSVRVGQPYIPKLVGVSGNPGLAG